MPRGIPTSGKRTRRAPLKQKAVCSIGDCDNLSLSRGYCQTHYSRFRRHGDPHKTAWVKGRNERVSDHGYLWQTIPDHPLATGGMVYAHRRVLYDAIGPGSHPCFWCRAILVWRGRGSGAIHVDHLDGDKLNNELSNLKVSCKNCNANRGLFQRWIMKHKDDPFLIQMFERKP